MDIRCLERKDIPQALALCSQVGWNHTEADWLRVMALQPQGCIGGYVGGVLMATCTVVGFGPVGWVGVFLVDESLRGKGEGQRLFAAMLEAADRLGIRTLGLDSSDAGRPIYLKFGFQMTAVGNELWGGPNGGGRLHPDVTPLEERDWDSLMALDRGAVDADRARQLRLLSAEPGAAACVVRRQGGVEGFGFSRPGKLSGVIGPVVADSFDSARILIESLVAARRERDGERGVSLAVLEQSALKEWLAGNGFQLRRRNIRMCRPAARPVFGGDRTFVSTALGMG